MKFLIVTASWNSEKFITETIESVISQEGPFEIEYVIVDNESTDRTVAIVEGYIQKMENSSRIRINLITGQDRGLYDAINKGFSGRKGEIMAWINSDDVYQPGAFQKVAEVFSSRPHIQWLKGITSYIDERSEITERGECYRYRQDWIEKGFYGRELGFIQQDSVFWRKSLWDRAGPTDASLRLAGDYALWVAFSRFEPLYSLNEEVSCFRKVQGQLSSQLERYRAEMTLIVPERINRWGWFVLKVYRRWPSLFLNNRCTDIIE